MSDSNVASAERSGTTSTGHSHHAHSHDDGHHHDQSILPMRVRLLGFFRFEGVLALLLAALPVLLLLVDGEESSISSYHDMDDPRWFLMPLTAAVVMLIVNGLVRPNHHGYNAVLGVLLLGVVVFDHDGDSRIPHGVSAISFFVLALAFAALQITDYQRGSESNQRQIGFLVILVAAIAALVLGLIFGVSLFWGEAAGLWIIAVHYIWHSDRHARNIDNAEPPEVFRRLCPRCYEMLAALLRPLRSVWLWLNQS